MGKFERTAITIADAKESALYFDYIIPVNYGLEIVKSYWNLYEKRKQPDETPPQFFSHCPFTRVFPLDFLDNVLPPMFVHDHDFRSRLLDINANSGEIVTAKDENERWDVANKFGKLCCDFLREYGLTATPVDIPDLVIFDDEETDDESEIAVTLPSLNLVDAQHASWEQILEFRRDEDAHNKMRRLRLFALENYSGKSKTFIEDDLSVRLSDFQEAVRKWGFETKYAAFTTILSSKILAGALTGTLVSALLDAPLPAAGSALVGVALEVGRITMEVKKRRFALRSLMAENPVCYISEARSRLSGKD